MASSERWPLNVRVELASTEHFGPAFAISTELESAVLAPVGAPGVLDDPVFVAALLSAFAVAN